MEGGCGGWLGCVYVLLRVRWDVDVAEGSKYFTGFERLAAREVLVQQRSYIFKQVQESVCKYSSL